MSPKPFLHERGDFSALLQIVGSERKVLPALVEKDYWIMHCLYGLGAQGFSFELKGGTSLSKGFALINRFSEDIDIRIDPGLAGFEVFSGPNHNKSKHVDTRKKFFNWLASSLRIPGIVSCERDTNFDDTRYYRGAGIRLRYESHFEMVAGIKPGVLLEVGFDDTAPNEKKTIFSWALTQAMEQVPDVFDNRAMEVPCYLPGYTFVEKLQAISTKFRQAQQSPGKLPSNFLRHYYDVSQLLDHPQVKTFIQTPAYTEHKQKRFRKGDEQIIAHNEAFLLRDATTRALYAAAFEKTRNLYFGTVPNFEDILSKIHSQIKLL